MRFQPKYKEAVVTIICNLHIILFTYAALSKLLDFQNFQAQLGQSPLLSAFAAPVSYSVITVELMISILLVFSRTRLIGLFAAFSLMVMFTAYIYIMLNYSSYVPCSCGGILEKLGWQEHLFFNLAFVILGATATLLLSEKYNPSAIATQSNPEP